MRALLLLILTSLFATAVHARKCESVAMAATQIAVNKTGYQAWEAKPNDLLEPVPEAVFNINNVRVELSSLGLSDRNVDQMIRTLTRAKPLDDIQLEMHRAYYYYLHSCKLAEQGHQLLSMNKSSSKLVSCLNRQSFRDGDPIDASCVELAIAKYPNSLFNRRLARD